MAIRIFLYQFYDLAQSILDYGAVQCNRSNNAVGPQVPNLYESKRDMLIFIYLTLVACDNIINYNIVVTLFSVSYMCQVLG